MAGEVIGVNSMAARNGSIGFAIPANLVKMLVPPSAGAGGVTRAASPPSCNDGGHFGAPIP
jgi:S1-C subfamily serine protease